MTGKGTTSPRQRGGLAGRVALLPCLMGLAILLAPVVVAQEDAAPVQGEEEVLEILTTESRSAEEVAEALWEVLPETWMKVKPGPQNTLIVKGLPKALLPIIRQVISRFDSPGENYQVSVSVFEADSEGSAADLLADSGPLVNRLLSGGAYKLADRGVVAGQAGRECQLTLARGMYQVQFVMRSAGRSAEAEIHRKLETRLPYMTWNNLACTEVLGALGTITGLNFVQDERTIEPVFGSLDDVLVTLALRDVTVKDILDHVSRKTGLVWYVDDGAVIVGAEVVKVGETAQSGDFIVFDEFVLSRQTGAFYTKEGDVGVWGDPGRYSALLETSFRVKQGQPIIVGASQMDAGSDTLVIVLTVQGVDSPLEVVPFARPESAPGSTRRK